MKRPQVGAKGLVYARVEADGNVKSSVDKFYSQEVLQEMKNAFGAKPGDLILILSGDDAMKTRKQLCELRLEMGNQLGLRDKDKFVCCVGNRLPRCSNGTRTINVSTLCTIRLPLRIRMIYRCWTRIRALFVRMRMIWLSMALKWVVVLSVSTTANYRIRCSAVRFTEEKSARAIRFLDECVQVRSASSWRFGLWLDRFVSLFAGLDSIRDCIAFPKNNSGRDVMLDAPVSWIRPSWTN